MTRPQFHDVTSGGKTLLPFPLAEYEARLALLRALMDAQGVQVAVLTSMHNIACHSGFLHCSFGRPYGLVVTAGRAVVISAGIDASQPFRRSAFEAITYTDWERNNYWRAVRLVAGTGRVAGMAGDHLTLKQRDALQSFLAPSCVLDIAPATMRQRMIKSPAERADRRGRKGRGCGRPCNPRRGARGRAVDRCGDGGARCDGDAHRGPVPRRRIPRYRGLVPVGAEH